MEITEKSLKNILQEQREEYQRSVGVVVEDFRHDMAAIGEQYNGINEKIDGIKNDLEDVKETLDSHTEMIVSLKENVEVIKADIHTIKNDLKEKVGRDEFVALERRIDFLEKKFQTHKFA